MRLTPVFAAVCLLSVGCHHKEEIVFIDPALATLTPPDTTLLVGASLDKVRQTATYQRHFACAHIAARPGGAGFQSFRGGESLYDEE